MRISTRNKKLSCR